MVEDDPSRPWTEPGVFRVAAGVHRIPLPMPDDGLRAINVYAIEDGDSLLLIDSGVAVPGARSALESALADLGRGLPDIDRFLVTHVHYDHYSQALDLRPQFGTPISLGRGEQPSLEKLADRSIGAFERQVELLHRYGAHQLARTVQEDFEVDSDKRIVGFPDDWLDDDVKIAAGDTTLLATHTPGHTRGHIIFSERERGLTFAGDHVLPRITPSIGFEPEPGDLPLLDYLRSLRRVREMPDARLLPAHGPTAPSVHARVDELVEHHRVRLEQCYEAVDHGAATALQVAERLPWTRRERAFAELDAYNGMLAVLETGAHLELLAAQDRLCWEDDERDALLFTPS